MRLQGTDEHPQTCRQRCWLTLARRLNRSCCRSPTTTGWSRANHLCCCSADEWRKSTDQHYYLVNISKAWEWETSRNQIFLPDKKFFISQLVGRNFRLHCWQLVLDLSNSFAESSPRDILRFSSILSFHRPYWITISRTFWQSCSQLFNSLNYHH